ncbi:tyrosine recombinase XerS [Levilactobacillus angrenensis]|uniref:Tyrosine recombinase XerS n=1 Tax=Levilactobacillus angrenensis TaxID=2486020 RepID=A0ABW1U5I8_9LACO|nr:tyrosine recombinase XerS [Levilactobacillus angrenensis]
MRKDDYERNNDKMIAGLPSFVRDYYNAKRSIPLAPTTLYTYLNALVRFFDWLRATKVTDAPSNQSIPLDTLDQLHLADAELYKADLLNRSNQNDLNSDRNLSRSYVDINLSALKSLFRYLAVDSEGPDGRPFMQRNVMEKIPLVKNNKTLQQHSKEIEHQLLVDGEDISFMEYVDHQYENGIDAHQQSYFKNTKVRDLAILATFLSSGIRLSELCNLDLRKVHIENPNEPSITVIRKGGNTDTVYMRTTFLDYIQQYLDVREHLFPGAEDCPAMFISSRGGRINRISTRTVETMVAKYSKAYGKPFHPHSLRHSVASELYKKTGGKEQVVRLQLGHTSTSAVKLYENIEKNEQLSSIRDL